jgi:hypothetical protein
MGPFLTVSAGILDGKAALRSIITTRFFLLMALMTLTGRRFPKLRARRLWIMGSEISYFTAHIFLCILFGRPM